MPSWWMPASCAKALSPTIALLGCTGTETMALSARLVGKSSVVTTAVRAAERVAADLERHHDLFERGVAGALADAVDGALDLARAGLHRGERVGHREAQVVVAMRREHGAVADALAAPR